MLASARAPLAQDALVAARDLYKAAMYEDALVRLNTLRGSAHMATDDRVIEQYRAFCLLALGRTSEAERAIEAVVKAAPSFRPSEAEESPRVRSAFTDVRRRVLPDIIQERYAHAKAAFDRHEFSSAKTEFQQLIELLGDPDLASVASRSPLAELRTLAAGFLDLSTNAEPRAARSPLPSANVPSVARAPGARAVAGRIYGVQDVEVVAPVVVRESLAPLRDVFAVRIGVVTIVIDETGGVESAKMTVSVNPVYDRLALSTAKDWRYKPATLDGVPVKFRKVILLDLKPTR
jgi:TonB family protein